jgi:hypothetical protein
MNANVTPERRSMRAIVTGATTWTDAGALRREFAALPSQVIILQHRAWRREYFYVRPGQSATLHTAVDVCIAWWHFRMYDHGIFTPTLRLGTSSPAIAIDASGNE